MTAIIYTIIGFVLGVICSTLAKQEKIIKDEMERLTLENIRLRSKLEEQNNEL